MLLVCLCTVFSDMCCVFWMRLLKYFSSLVQWITDIQYVLLIMWPNGSSSYHLPSPWSQHNFGNERWSRCTLPRHTKFRCDRKMTAPAHVARASIGNGFLSAATFFGSPPSFSCNKQPKQHSRPRPLSISIRQPTA